MILLPGGLTDQLASTKKSRVPTAASYPDTATGGPVASAGRASSPCRLRLQGHRQWPDPPTFWGLLPERSHATWERLEEGIDQGFTEAETRLLQKCATQPGKAAQGKIRPQS
jgi:hypothetical protein